MHVIEHAVTNLQSAEAIIRILRVNKPNLKELVVSDAAYDTIRNKVNKILKQYGTSTAEPRVLGNPALEPITVPYDTQMKIVRELYGPIPWDQHNGVVTETKGVWYPQINGVAIKRKI